MRTLNVKLAVILVVVIVVVSGSAHLLHSYQVQRHSTSFKTQATAAWNDNPRRVPDALRLMQAYVHLVPQDYEASEQLGFWYFESGKTTNAVLTLEELMRGLEKQNPPDAAKMREVRWELIKSYMAQGRLVDAKYYLEMLKKEPPVDVEVLFALGKCLISLKEFDGPDGALANLSAALAKAPDNVDIYVKKAMTLRFSPMHNGADADKCMAEMIAYWNKDPSSKDKEKSAYAHHVYGLWLDEVGNHEEALNQAEATLALHKDHPAALYLAGKSELAVKHFPKAEEYSRRAVQADPQSPGVYILLADVYVGSDQRDKAIEVLKEGVETVQKKDGKAALLWNLTNMYLDPKGTDAERLQAVDCIKRLRDYHFPSDQLDFLDARVLYVNDDWKAALAGFETVRPKLADPQLLKCLDFWIGDCYLQQGNPDQAMAAFRRSLSFDKYYFEAHDRIAQIFLSNGNPKDAMEEYRQAEAGNPTDPVVWLAYARTLVRWNLGRSPAERNWDLVKKVLKHIAENIAPNNGEVPLLYSQVDLAEGHPEEAEKKLESIRQDAPDDASFWVAQADVAAGRGDLDQAKTILDDAKAKLHDIVPIRLAHARIVLRELGLQAGAELEKLGANADAFSAQEKIELWTGLLDYLVEIKEYDLAKQFCRQVAELRPHDATIRYRLLELDRVTYDARNPAASMAELDRVLGEIDTIAGRGPLWMFGKAVRLTLEAARNKPELLDAAMDYARQAQKQRRAWSRPHRLQGDICRQRGNDDEALQHYLDASVNGDRDLDFIRQLLQMLHERQRYQEAEQVIHRLDSDQTHLTLDIKVKEADIFIPYGEFERALELANSAYNPTSDKYSDHLWHGQMLAVLARRAQQEGHLDKLPEIAQQAEKSLRRACQLSPNTPDCHVALVQLLVATNQKPKALIAASDAEEAIPLAASPLAMGYIYEALGEPQKAGQSFEKAVKLRPDLPTAIRLLADFYLRNGQPERALPLIDRLLSGDVRTSESELVGARRIKATILARQGYPKYKEAVGLIDRNLDSPLASAEDERLKFKILRADAGQDHGPQVLALAEKLVASVAEPEPEDRSQLAHLYLSRGMWDRCREQMEKLINSSQSNPGYLADYIRMLLDQVQLGDAEQLLDRLDRIANNWEPVDLRAELKFRNKKWSEVPGFLAAYVGREGAEPKDPLDRALLAARLLEDLGDRLTSAALREQAKIYFEKAGEWYESYNQKHAGGQMILAAFYARHGKISAAIDLIERFGANASPWELGNAAVAVIHREDAAPQHLQQVETVLNSAVSLQKAASQQKQSIPLLTALTELKVTQGKFAEGEELCRQIIAKQPENYLAYNNLGVLLALAGNKPDEALAMVNRAIELVGPLPLLLDSRATVHLARNEAAEALNDLASIQADKVDPVWLFHKARALALAGRIDEAGAAMVEARHKGLDRAQIDPPERKLFDQLQQQLVKREEPN